MEYSVCLMKLPAGVRQAHYVASFGIVRLGAECRNLGIAMTRKYSEYMWGWPYNFLLKAQDINSPVYLMVDSNEDYQWAQAIPVDGIVTDHIDTIGPMFQN